MSADAVACRCERGWRCEAHPDQAYPHDGCDLGAGMPCQNPLCPYWQGSDPLALDPSVQYGETFIDRHAERQRAQRRHAS